MHKLAYSILFVSLMFWAVACGDDDDDWTYIPPETDGDAAVVDQTNPLIVPGGDQDEVEEPVEGLGGFVWDDCTLYMDGSGPSTKCLTMQVPLNYDNPEGRQIDFYVRRYPADAGTREGQIWLLQGGPGASGYDYAPFAETLHTYYPTMDILFPDHRGVGFSTRLGCPVQEGAESSFGQVITMEEMPACMEALQVEYGEDLKGFSATGAALDVGNAIDKLMEPDQKLYVYGASYGTYWALRYMQLFPEQGANVILDSICASGYCFFNDYDLNYNMVGQNMMALCAEDEFCTSKLGEDPWGKLGEVLDKIGDGHCSQIIDAEYGRDFYRNLFGMLVMYWDLRVFIPAIVYRLDRCELADVQAITKLLDVLLGGSDKSAKGAPGAEAVSEDMLFSLALNYHVGISELWKDEDFDYDALTESVAQTYISRDASLGIGYFSQEWPRYEHDEYWGVMGDFAGPILMLNGTLDPQTTFEIAEPLGQIYTGENQTFVTFPRYTHGVVFEITDLESDAMPCGLSIFFDFLDSPTEAGDLSCVDQIPAIYWPGNPNYTMALFETEDMYENSYGAKKAASVIAKEPPSLKDFKRKLRRKLILNGIAPDMIWKRK